MVRGLATPTSHTPTAHLVIIHAIFVVIIQPGSLIIDIATLLTGLLRCGC